MLRLRALIAAVATVGSLALAPLPTAQATTCPAVTPHVKGLDIAGSGGKFPRGGATSFLGTSVITQLPKGAPVYVQIVCGPDKGPKHVVGKVQTVSGRIDVGPGVPAILVPVHNNGTSGTDTVSVTVGSGSSQRGPATISVTWASPVDCGVGLPKLGYLLALQCAGKSALANQYVQLILKGATCALGAATFFVPEAKIAKFLQEAKAGLSAAVLARNAKILGAAAANTTPLGDLAFRLAELRRINRITAKQLAETFSAAKDLPEFLRNIPALTKNLTTKDASDIALDIAKLAGLGTCVELAARVVAAFHKPTPTPTPTPTAPPTTPPASGGTVYAWGSGISGALGNGQTSDSSVPVPVTGLTGVTAIAGGNDAGYALKSDGTVYAWGAGLSGELGNGQTSDSSVPVKVTGLTGVTAIAGNFNDGYALQRN